MDLIGVSWRKASYSSANGGDCIEIGVWRKASYSSANGGDCVEVSAAADVSLAPPEPGAELLYLVRDSKDPDGPKLAFSAGEWDAFLAGAKGGEFDLLAPAAPARA